MPVKNVGKLVRGVRQIKEQQDSPPAAAATESAPVAATVKPVSPRASAKPAPAKPVKSEVQHPDRVWPD